MKTILITLVAQFFCLTAFPQSDIRLTDLNVNNSYAYYDKKLYTGRAVNFDPENKTFEFITYKEGIRNGIAWWSDNSKNIKISDYDNGKLKAWRFISPTGDTLFNIDLKDNKAETKLINIDLFIKDENADSIPRARFCLLDNLELMIALKYTYNNGKTELKPLDNWKINSISLLSVKFNSTVNENPDNGYKITGSLINKKQIESLCSDYPDWLALQNIQIITDKGTDLNLGNKIIKIK